MYCRAFRNRGLDVRVLRFANVYGPRDSDRVIPIWIRRAESGQDLKVYGGRQVIDFISVSVVAEALLCAAETGSWHGAVNIGSGTGTRITDLASKIINLSGSSSKIRFLPAREEEVVGYVADVSAMEQVLGILRPADPLDGLPALLNLQPVR
jgi:UDP-glucose 4-epimerase